MGCVMALIGCTALPSDDAPTGPAPVVSAVPVVSAASAAAAAAAASAARALLADPQTLADAASRRLLAFHERVREMQPADLAREQLRLDAARQAPEGGDANEAAAATLELALLLAQTRVNGDLGRALALTEPLARGAAPARWQPMARLLAARLADQRRAEEQTEKQAQQLRDQQRRIDQLNSQLEALKAIERSLNTRPAAPPGAGSTPATPGAAAAPGGAAPSAPLTAPAAPRAAP